MDRTSHWRCSVKRVFLKFFTNFTGKHLCWGLWNFETIKNKFFYRTTQVAASEWTKRLILNQYNIRLYYYWEIIETSCTLFSKCSGVFSDLLQEQFYKNKSLDFGKKIKKKLRIKPGLPSHRTKKQCLGWPFLK